MNAQGGDGSLQARSDRYYPVGPTEKSHGLAVLFTVLCPGAGHLYLTVGSIHASPRRRTMPSGEESD